MRKIWIYALLFLVVGCATKIEENQNQNEDKNPPIINVKSFIFETIVGNPINIETATAWDDQDGTCDVRVDGQVNFNKVGEYYLRYTTIDLSGNKAETSFTVIVKEKANIETAESNTNSNENTGCTNQSSYDPTLPCEHMITDVSEMLVIYQDDSGFERCQTKIEQLGEKDYYCEKLYRNDQEVWGYGIIKNKSQ